VREGFVLSVRSSQAPTKAELRFLLDRVLHDWGALAAELGLAESADSGGGGGHGRMHAAVAPRAEEDEGLLQLRHQLLAFGMAATALGLLPRTPAEQITFPYSFGQPPTYGDIPAPATPGAMLARIEELERMLWQLMAADLQEIVNHQYGPLRRTYGFFEVSARLANHEAQRFGMKRGGVTALRA
jgi:hypothetical protein